MGYAMVFGECVVCKRPLAFNPVKVPSIRVNGVREPVCAACIEVANVKRKEMGLPEFPPPHPDAYEACNENEL